jgi:hypothetical protein
MSSHFEIKWPVTAQCSKHFCPEIHKDPQSIRNVWFQQDGETTNKARLFLGESF